MTTKLFIAITGMIGAGKTTLAHSLGKILDLPVYEENVVDNTYLTDFYGDMKKYSFPLQIHLLNRRFEQQQVIIWQGKGGIQDRSIYEDSIFARMLCASKLMDKRDYETYIELFNNMANFMRQPSIIVHLDVTPEESLERIKMRSRDCESSVSIEYLQSLYRAYEEFLQDISKTIPVIKIRYNKFYPPEKMAEMIMEEYKKLHVIHTTTNCT
jgi:deoxyadenosine kinase